MCIRDSRYQGPAGAHPRPPGQRGAPLAAPCPPNHPGSRAIGRAAGSDPGLYHTGSPHPHQGRKRLCRAVWSYAGMAEAVALRCLFARVTGRHPQTREQTASSGTLPIAKIASSMSSVRPIESPSPSLPPVQQAKHTSHPRSNGLHMRHQNLGGNRQKSESSYQRPACARTLDQTTYAAATSGTASEMRHNSWIGNVTEWPKVLPC